MNKTVNKSPLKRSLSDFRKCQRVLYVPTHAHGDLDHPDCKRGVVSSVNDWWVFVKYDNAMCTMTTGDEPYTAAATSHLDLIILSNNP